MKPKMKTQMMSPHKFNICKKCGNRLKIVASQRLETCRIRTYFCRKCKDIKKSIEHFYNGTDDSEEK